MISSAVHNYSRFFCTGCGRSFDVPLSCGNRFCDVCNFPRKSRIRRKLRFILGNIAPLPNYRIRFITLTIPNAVRLDVGARVLIQSFRRLRQRKWWFNRVSGGCHVIETTGRPGAWNIHLHVIVYSRFLPVRQLSHFWNKCSPGSIVHIKFIPLTAVVNYVTSYITKSDLSEPDQVEASSQLKGFRLFQPFGSWHDLALRSPKSGYECPHCRSTSLFFSRQIDRVFDRDLHGSIAFHRH